MPDLIAIISLSYLIVAVLLLIGLQRQETTNEGEPVETGSLILCARDEEIHLPACLQSIEEQRIEPDRLEIVLVDDASTDRTAAIMDAFAAKSRFTVKVVHLLEPLTNEPRGKWRALKEGIKAAGNDAFLMTDANAILPPGWAEAHLRELTHAEISAGFALIEGDSKWERIQQYDWLYILAAGSALANWGIPQSALGKNMAIRRSTYEKLGGFDGIGFSLTEDLALVQAAVATGAAQAFPLRSDLMVKSTGVKDWQAFMQQRLRWVAGLKHLKSSGRAILALMALRNLALVYAILNQQSSAFGFWVFTSLGNWLIIQTVMKKLGLSIGFISFLLWEIFYTLTTPLQGLYMLFNRRVSWKGREY